MFESKDNYRSLQIWWYFNRSLDFLWSIGRIKIKKKNHCVVKIDVGPECFCSVIIITALYVNVLMTDDANRTFGVCERVNNTENTRNACS